MAADGVVQQPDFSSIGESIKQALMMRYQAGMGQQAQAQEADLARQKMRTELLSRLSLAGQGGAPIDANALLNATGGGQLPPGTTATPVQMGAAELRNQGAAATSGQRNHAELTKNLKNYDTSKWGPEEYGKYYESGVIPAGAKPIQKPAGKGGGGKDDPRLKQLQLKEKAAHDAVTAAMNKIKSNTIYSPTDHAALDKANADWSKVRDEINGMKSGGGEGGGAAADLLNKYGVPGSK